MTGGITLILVLALMGGLIAYLGDKLGSKIGKKRLRLFGLRPHDTSVVMTILSGILVAVLTITVLTISSKEVRTALFGMKKMRAEIASLTTARDQANQELQCPERQDPGTGSEDHRGYGIGRPGQTAGGCGQSPDGAGPGPDAAGPGGSGRTPGTLQ